MTEPFGDPWVNPQPVAILEAQLAVEDDLIRQRDSARAWAAEYIRRVDAAALRVADMYCLGEGVECAHCALSSLLAGDS